MRVFSYVVAKDAGFAPNPFRGCCTLACCKPMIRKAARVGDLIFGLSSRCESLVYAGRVARILDNRSYWEAAEFRGKRPDWGSRRIVDRVGDNIYEPRPDESFTQHRSAHWNHVEDRPDLRHVRRDTGPDAILAMPDFVYFGGDGPNLPEELSFLEVTRGHRSRFSRDEVSTALEFFEALPRGILGRPTLWSNTDSSWRPSSCA